MVELASSLEQAMPASVSSKSAAFESDYLPFTPSGLHDRMMVESETLIKQNWTAVAIHDRNQIAKLPLDHVLIWVVRPEGTNVLKTFCSLADKERHLQNLGKPFLDSFEAFFVRCQDRFIKFRGFDPRTYHYYVIRKGLRDECLIPSSFEELLDLAFVGQLKWTELGIQPTGVMHTQWENK